MRQRLLRMNKSLLPSSLEHSLKQLFNDREGDTVQYNDWSGGGTPLNTKISTPAGVELKKGMQHSYMHTV